MEISHIKQTNFVNKNKRLIFCSGLKPAGIFFYAFMIVLLLLMQRPVLAANDTNESEPNTVAELFRPDLMYTHQDRVDKIIQILEKESVEESLDKLYEYELYMWPGHFMTLHRAYTGDIPLPETIGNNNILHILGNRRFLKVIDELSKLPKEQAEELVNKEIFSSLEEYKKLFDEFMVRNAKFFEKDPKIRVQNREAIGFGGHPRGGKPSLTEMRYKVLALVLIAGNLELKQTQPAIEKIFETAIEQRSRFYNKNLWHEWDSFIILDNASLYNRQILATGVLGVSIEAEKGDEILKSRGCKITNERHTKFDSPVGVYDLSRQQQGKATDYSKGELNIKYLSPLDDSAFDNLINAVKAEQAAVPADANSV